MDTDLRDELRNLRARAFGPDADIAQDPAALRRLRELERLASARSTETPDAAGREPAPGSTAASRRTPAAAPTPAESPIPAAPATAAASVSAATSLAATADPTEPAPARPDAPPARRPRELSARLRGLWALSLIAAAAVSGGVTYGLSRVTPVSASSGAPQIATLEPTRTVDLPSGWMGAGPSSAVYEFHDLILFESNAGFGMSTGMECLTAVAREDVPGDDYDPNAGYSVGGNMYSGCRVGPFLATISIFVDSGVPEDLRETYPDSALQFVKDGERIGVFLAAE